MKKQILLGTVAFLFYGTTAFGQGGTLGHTSVPLEYLGWAGPGFGPAQPLNIRNNFNQPINVFTNNFQRLTINHLAFGMPLVPFSTPPFNNLNSLPGTRLTRVGISYDGGKPDGADL